LPVPLSSSVQVTGSPTAAFSGTTFDVSLNCPTAPLNPGGAAGRARTSSVGWSDVTETCSMRGCEMMPNPIVPVWMLSR
jgi:hypothetical protein